MSYQKYYENQCGNGGREYFSGTRYQRGHGLGNVLGGFIRAALPFLKKTAMHIGKDLANTGLVQGGKLIADVIQGKPLRSSIKRRIRDGGLQLVNKRLKTHKVVQPTKGLVKKRRSVVRKRTKDIFQ